MLDSDKRNNQSRRPTFKEQYRAAARSLPLAFRNVRPYVVIGLTFGFGLLAFGRLVELWIMARPAFRESVEWLMPAFEHLGAGFIVSALAVFFYEWGAEAKELFLLTERMVSLIERDLQPITQAVAHEAIFRALDALEPSSTDAGKAFREIFSALQKLKTQGDWNRSVYFEFAIEWLTDVAKNVNRLADLCAKMAAAPMSRPDICLELPKAGSLAATLLSKEVSRLGAGGSYSALSDVDSWRVLDDFVIAQREAVKRGVVVRRIFLLPEKAKRDTGATVTLHARYATEWTAASVANRQSGRYEMRVADEDVFRATVRELSVERHFGVFANGDVDAAAVAFQVRRDDLSIFTLTGITQSHELAKEYERLWDKLAKQRHVDVADLLLRSEMHALRRNGRYSVVSDFESWDGRGLAQFHKACLEGIRERAIHVRRVFVVTGKEEVSKCRAILKRHLHDQRSVKGEGSYEIRICHVREAEAVFDANWQFGFFVASGGDAEEVRYIVAESSKPRMTDFYMWSTEDLARAPLFESLWSSVGTLQQRLPKFDRDWLS